MCKIAIAQTNSTDNLTQNLENAIKFIEESAQQKAQLIAFPENFLYLGHEDDFSKTAETIPGAMVDKFCHLAEKHEISILMGTILEKDPDNEKRVYNTSLLIDKKGKIVAKYQKIHLFDALLADVNLEESKKITAGKSLVVCQHDIGKIGLAICYDLRFPVMFQKLVEKGAEIIFLPAAFIIKTGKDHWIPLLQARAIENQVYIVAPAQFGRHNKKRASFGNSVLIDPWGTVVSRAPEKACLITGNIDLDYLREVRRNMPVGSHKVKNIDY